MFKKRAAYLLLPIAYCLLFVTVVSCSSKQKVSLIIHHAKIYTANVTFSVAEAMAINEGKVIAIGTNEEILKNYRGNEERDAGGRPVFPGFIDAHAHFAGYGMSLLQVDLVGTESWEECIERIKEFVSGKGKKDPQYKNNK